MATSERFSKIFSLSLRFVATMGLFVVVAATIVAAPVLAALAVMR